MRRCTSWLGLFVLATLLGCAGRVLRTDARSHGNFAAVIARGLTRSPEPSEPAVAILFGEAEAMAVDLHTGTTRWRRPVRVLGAPVAAGRRIAVPVRGHKLLLLDADTGATIWERRLPGEAFTGVAMTDRRVVATVVAGEPSTRSLLVAMSAADGRSRWTRRSETLLGVPGALGRHIFVPTSNEVIAFAEGRGREVARMRPPAEVGALGRIELHGRTALAAGAHAFVDLHGGGQTVYRIDPHTAPAFRVVDGLDPGVGHGDGLAWKLRPIGSAGAPREAVLMARRAALGVRLDADGRPVLAHWVHRQTDARELVALGVDDRLVTFVREDGSIVQLDARTGDTVAELDGRAPVSSAVLVGASTSATGSEQPSAREHGGEEVVLLALLEDPDPRLVPAQRLAIELLWRHALPAARTNLADFVQGAIRPGDDPITDELRQHAQAVMQGPWGPDDDATRREVARTLAAARRGAQHRNDLESIAARVVSSGNNEVLGELIALLEQPSLRAEELVAITRALRDLDDHRAVTGVATFVLRYHADPDVVEESQAMLYALDFLVAQAREDAFEPTASERAREVLIKLTEDRFTVPRLRAFLLERMPT
jgi:hypothetical protein